MAGIAVGVGGGGAGVGTLQAVSWQEAAVGKWDASAVTNNDGLGTRRWRRGRTSPHSVV